MGGRCWLCAWGHTALGCAGPRPQVCLREQQGLGGVGRPWAHGAAGEVVGQEALGGKGSEGRHLLDPLRASPCPAETMVEVQSKPGDKAGLGFLG